MLQSVQQHVSLEEARRRARIALREIHSSAADAAWAAAPPRFTPSEDGMRWDVHLGQAWSMNGYGARLLQQALGADFGRELHDSFDDFRFPHGGRQILIDAGESRNIGPALYTGTDIDAACAESDATRYSLLAIGDTAIRTVRRLQLASRRSEVVTVSRPLDALEGVLKCDSAVDDNARPFAFDLGTVVAIAPILPELSIVIRRPKG